MNTLVSGSTGLVGSALVEALTSKDHRVVRLTRSESAQGEPAVQWDPASGTLEPSAFDGIDAVVHLAGESIAEGRWTDAKKARIRDSRVEGTQLLCRTLASLQTRPRALVCASAIGFYGDRGDERLTEESPPGAGFLPDVCRQWEDATAPARDAGVRVVNLRIGIVLSPRGGALGKMLPPFKMGVGGVLGDGRQFMSWITRGDLVAVIEHALKTEALSGPLNAVSPQPVTNRQFTKTLGSVLGRPTVFPMPAFAARLVFGEMADALLLSSTRVVPAKLNESEFPFQHTDLESALRDLLAKDAGSP